LGGGGLGCARSPPTPHPPTPKPQSPIPKDSLIFLLKKILNKKS